MFWDQNFCTRMKTMFVTRSRVKKKQRLRSSPKQYLAFLDLARDPMTMVVLLPMRAEFALLLLLLPCCLVSCTMA